MSGWGASEAYSNVAIGTIVEGGRGAESVQIFACICSRAEMALSADFVGCCTLV